MTIFKGKSIRRVEGIQASILSMDRGITIPTHIRIRLHTYMKPNRAIKIFTLTSIINIIGEWPWHLAEDLRKVGSNPRTASIKV